MSASNNAPPPVLWGVLFLLIATGVWAHVDLRLELAELKGELRSLDRAPAADGRASVQPPPGAAAPAGPGAGAPGSTDAGAGQPAPSPGPTHPRPPAPGPDSASAAQPPPIDVNDPQDWQRCAGRVEPAAVQATIGRHGRQVFACYNERLAQAPGLAGSASLMLLVGPEGQVAGVHVGGDLEDPALRKCIGEAALAWRFSTPQGGSCAVVLAPFNLAPPAAPDAPDAPAPPSAP